MGIIATGFIAVAVLFATFFIPQVHANPLILSGSWRTAAATTTVAYLAPGLATTTLSIDTYAYANGNPTPYRVDSGVLEGQFTASTTGSGFRARVEFSEDNIDWYPESVNMLGQGNVENATSTSLFGSPAIYSIVTSTTTANTDGFGGSGTAARIHFSMPMRFISRYVRVVFWSRAGDGNGALWAGVIPAKQKAQ